MSCSVLRKQRDVIRQGVVSSSVTFSASAVWLKKLSALSKWDKMVVQYFDTEILEIKETEMYVGGFEAKLYRIPPTRDCG